MWGQGIEAGPQGQGIRTKAGHEVRSFGSRLYEYGPEGRVNPIKPQNVKMPGGGSLSGAKGWKPGGLLGPALGIGLSSYFIIQGIREDGLKGGFDAGVRDFATMSAIGKFGWDRIPGTGKHLGTVTNPMVKAWTPFGRSGLVAHMGIGIAAYTGAAMGQEIAGPFGAIAGAFAGGGLARLAGKHPVAALITAAAVGGAYMIGKGTYQFLKSGYRKRQEGRGLNTAGSTAAFYTRQAVTMRQRAVQAIHKSHVNARSALGQEASFMHMPEKNYFSTYRRMGNMM